MTRKQLEARTREAMPEVTLYFCGSCGCYDRSQDHAPDCEEWHRTPRVPMRYVPAKDEKLGSGASDAGREDDERLDPDRD